MYHLRVAMSKHTQGKGWCYERYELYGTDKYLISLYRFWIALTPISSNAFSSQLFLKSTKEISQVLMSIFTFMVQNLIELLMDILTTSTKSLLNVGVRGLKRLRIKTSSGSYSSYRLTFTQALTTYRSFSNVYFKNNNGAKVHWVHVRNQLHGY